MLIITENATWDAGSTRVLDGVVQIGHNVTLTIEAGATVVGGEFEVFGSMRVLGSSESPVHFSETTVRLRADYAVPGGRIDIFHAEFEGGAFLDGPGWGSFQVADSTFEGVGGFIVHYPTATSSFERNLFSHSAGLSIGAINSVIVRDNAFFEPTQPNLGSAMGAIVAWHNPNDAILLRGNTFSVPDGSLAIDLPTSMVYDLDATENYFATTSPEIIEGLVLDAADDLNRSGTVNYEGFLTQPSLFTPEVPLYVRGDVRSEVLLGSGLGDTIAPGGSDDILTGGAGSDFFVLDTGMGNDTITDFVLGEDILDFGRLSEEEWDAVTAGVSDEGDRVVRLGDGGSVTLTGVPGNFPPVGEVLVSGLPEVGATLMAETAALSDPDGLGDFAYQWLRDGLDILGATEATYAVVTADVGALLSVAVTYKDGFGSVEEVIGSLEEIVVTPGLLLVGTDASEILTGGGGDDTILGDDGNDTLEGGAGDDALDGGAGDDVIAAGGGADTITGGLGMDTVDLSGVSEFDIAVSGIAGGVRITGVFGIHALEQTHRLPVGLLQRERIVI
ncbi:calcium-binding protein [Aestuariicoccus sp. MJ-SS9]|uniref:calcium-binding protein n=1 Tax=Aestuariicoccus sp. MJ-SS9 TaxID=3079855 RepID=UPI00290837EE|nr:calcium-binding protein [Aestuariicoccus sp. MJ-SS9]MDU8914017.1 calcium-binding protein [Aestuariicoccus sp. MJ-SS9]